MRKEGKEKKMDKKDEKLKITGKSGGRQNYLLKKREGREGY